MQSPAGGVPQLGYRHQKVQRLRRLLRRRAAREAERMFVLEGYKLLEEATRAGLTVESVFTAPGASHPAIEAAHDAGARVYMLEPGVIERVADAVTPQPVMAVAPMIDLPLAGVADAASLVVLADVRDPGNAGTILRSAEASGAGGVVFCEGSVDLYNPKAVRSSAGSMFHVPVVNAGRPLDALETLRQQGFVTVGTTMEGGETYERADLTRKIALVLGNEANGLDETVMAELDEMVSIPIEGRSESLNVSMAASILCFEAARQRRSRDHRA